MVVSEFVDCVPILGSRRRAYIFLGGGLVAFGLVPLAGAAGRWITFAAPERLYVAAQLAVVVGSVIQEVVADAISPEVVARAQADGSPRPQADINRDLAMVEVLARLVYSAGAFAVALLAGVLAKTFPYSTVFLMGLVVPALSIGGALLVGPTADAAARSTGGSSAAASCSPPPPRCSASPPSATPRRWCSLLSLAVICLMLRRVMAVLTPDIRRRIALVAVAIFAFRAVPMIGDGYRWFAMDRLGFDETFFGVLQLTSTGVGPRRHVAPRRLAWCGAGRAPCCCGSPS